MKKTLGEKFQDKFINTRVRDPYFFVTEVEKFLQSHKLDYKVEYANHDSLVHEFFRSTSVIVYLNKDASKKCIVGKGITFDSGGYDLKTHMSDMFYDKNGAILSIATAIDTKEPCICFFAENKIGANHVVSGEILFDKQSGKSILIDNTDAEGRIGLAHCIGLALEKGYEKILTVATLTGSAHNYTGDRTYALVHSSDQDDLPFILKDSIDRGLDLTVARSHPEYDKAIKTKIKGATIRNCGDFKGAGSQTAFSFLKEFSKGIHHIHADIAAMMLDKNKNGYKWGIKEMTYLLSVL